MNANPVVYSTFRPTVTEAFKWYRTMRGKYGPNSNEARQAFCEYAEECERFHLKPVAEYERQLNLLRDKN